jgi:hypothetical protein
MFYDKTYYEKGEGMKVIKLSDKQFEWLLTLLDRGHDGCFETNERYGKEANKNIKFNRMMNDRIVEKLMREKGEK